MINATNTSFFIARVSFVKLITGMSTSFLIVLHFFKEKLKIKFSDTGGFISWKGIAIVITSNCNILKYKERIRSNELERLAYILEMREKNLTYFSKIKCWGLHVIKALIDSNKFWSQTFLDTSNHGFKPLINQNILFSKM